MEIIGTIVIFIVLLGVLVFVHEFGHFIVAKRFGVRVDEFGFGFPPRLFAKKFRDTVYSLNWIPLGGFVKIKGVAGDDSSVEQSKNDSDSFAKKSFSRKLFILLAGIAMNLALAVILFTIVFSVGSTTSLDQVEKGALISNEQVMISAILPESPADIAGVQPGDIILSINGDQVDAQTSDAVQKGIKVRNGEIIQLAIQRKKETISVEVVPHELQYNEEEYIGIGIGLQNIGIVRYPLYRALWLSIETTVSITGQIFIALIDLIRNVIAGQSVSQDLSGPVGIAVLTGEVAQLGIISLLQFAALLSINLAIFNLLPIPALDGGRIIFVLLEKVRKKPINHKIEATVHNIGFILLLLLVILVTVNDFSNFNIL